MLAAAVRTEKIRWLLADPRSGRQTGYPLCRADREDRAPTHDGLQARLGLTQHRHGSQDAFDETRAGLDHLAFTVADREELDAWAARLADAAVVHSPITAANSVPGAAVLVFRDPDNIQLELFAEPPS